MTDKEYKERVKRRLRECREEGVPYSLFTAKEMRENAKRCKGLGFKGLELAWRRQAEERIGIEMRHIRSHLGTKIRERISLRDLPEGPHAEFHSSSTSAKGSQFFARSGRIV